VPAKVDEADMRTAQCAQAIALYIGGEIEAESHDVAADYLKAFGKRPPT